MVERLGSAGHQYASSAPLNRRCAWCRDLPAAQPPASGALYEETGMHWRDITDLRAAGRIIARELAGIPQAIRPYTGVRPVAIGVILGLDAEALSAD